MPIIRVEMLEGRPVEKKRELVATLTRETARITGCTEASVYVVIEDVKKENWGVAGQLMADKYPDPQS
ncbi:MAG: 2-hydroxymuconate tautomerase family protein [Pseudomonadota bacterium]